MTDHLLIVGASLAGLKAAKELRSLGYSGRITMVGDEGQPPYDRPPLSKEFLLGGVAVENLHLATADEFIELDLELITGVRATALDEAALTVTLDTGAQIGYDKLLITTGARPNRPPWFRELAGLHLLRTLADACALRTAVASAGRIVIVGGGFIGTEAAASLRTAGKQVTVVTDGAALLEPLGTEVAERFTALHRERGVQVHTGHLVDDIEGDQHVRQVCLDDGRSIEADVVLVSVGARPNLDWAPQLVDSDTGAVSVAADGGITDTIWAAGDVTRGGAGHWFSAVRQGRRAARSILGVNDKATARLDTEVPYMWTDQYEFKVQVLGRVRPDDAFTLVDSIDRTPEKLIGLFSSGGTISGGVVVDRPRELAVMRKLVAAKTGVVTAEYALTAGGRP